MPIINSSSNPGLIVGLDLHCLEMTVTGSTVPGSRVNVDLAYIEMTVTAGALVPGSAAVDLDYVEITAQGRINADANVFGEADVELDYLNVTATGKLQQEGLIVVDFDYVDIDVDSTVFQAESAELNLIVDILPAAAAGNYLNQHGRLSVDGVAVPIRPEWSYREPSDRAGGELQVTLAKTSDRVLITRDSSIKFEIGKYVAGAWDPATAITLFDEGEISVSGHSLGWAEGGPTDTFTFSSASSESAKLSKAPETDLVFYDSSKMTLQQTDFEPLYDTEGNQYLTTLVPDADLKLYDLFTQIFVTRCGFSGWRTNLPDFNISRVDCPFGNGYLEALSGYIGMFDPAVFEAAGSTGSEIWIVDTTNALPAGFPAPRTVSISNYRSANSNANHQRIDAFLVIYAEDERNYDYFTTRLEQTTESSGTFGDPGYTETEIDITFREYRKFSNPAVVIKTDITSEIHRTFVNSQNVHETRESFTYDSFGRVTLRQKFVDALVPNFDAPGDPLQVLNVREEVETFSYKSHPYQARKQYLARRDLNVRGMIAVDSQNQQLGVDYKRDIKSAYRDGYLSEGTTTETGPIETVEETATPLRGGLVRVKYRKTDHLAKQVTEDLTEDRSGDVSMNGLTPTQNRILVFDADNAERSTERVVSFNGGELPLDKLLPLARRVLKKRKTKPNDLQMEYIGFDQTLRKGSTITAQGRGSNLGTFIIVGRTINGSREGVLMTLEGREI